MSAARRTNSFAACIVLVVLLIYGFLNHEKAQKNAELIKSIQNIATEYNQRKFQLELEHADPDDPVFKKNFQELKMQYASKTLSLLLDSEAK